MSDSLRPQTASSRPATGSRRSRPTTGNSERPDTAASSISSLGPAPHTFRPDLDDLSDGGEDLVEDSESEAEEGVFAFARPTTGAVPGFDGRALSPISQGGTFSHPPTTAGRRSTLADGWGGPPPSTADFSVAPPSVTFSQLEASRPATGTYSPWSAVYESGGAGDYSPDSRSGSDLGRPDSAVSPTQLAPVQQVLARDGERYLAGDSKFGYIESEASSSLSFPTSAGDTALSQPPVRMRSFAPLMDEGGRRRRSVKYAETEPGSDDGANLGSWQSHSLAGPTTIPHGEQDQHYDDDFEKGDIIADLEEDDSPYAEVRATVSNLDDFEMPALTFRVWIIGLLLSTLLASINSFLYYRSPAPNLSSTLGILLAYPLGKLAAAVLPITTQTCPAWLPFIGGARWSFNPCPFNIKEHGLITMMISVSNISAYGLQAPIAAAKYYSVTFPVGFEILIVLSTQMSGIAYAGLTQQLLIWPASLIWPAVLQLCSLLNTLHAGEESLSIGGSKGMTRLRLFYIVLVGSLFYYFLPGWIFTALSYFSWICWIAPNNVVVNQLFGSASGLGMGLLTFDWSQINYIGTPLVTPWWAGANLGAAFVIGYWIVVPAFYYSNTFSAKYLPIASSGSFDRYGAPYNLSRIIGSDFNFNATAYLEYSPVYISSALQVSYMYTMALAAAAIIHTGLFYGPRILQSLRGRKVEDDDVHARTMRRYKAVPAWWWVVVFVVFLSCGIAAVQAYPTQLPVWALLIAYLLPVIYVIPAGYVYALSGNTTAMCNVLSQIIAGVMFPGQGIPNMIFKAYAVNTLYVAGNYSSALKLGHYLKVPPKASFFAMVVAAFVTSFAQVGIKKWLFASTPDICTPFNANSLTCPQMRSFFTASVLWGIVGPKRQFGEGAMYNPLLYAFLVGALLPILLWSYLRRYPSSWLRDVNFPIAFSGPLFIPGVPALNTAVWVLVNFLTQYVVRRRYFRRWSKYNYILSVGLDTGTVIGVIIVFLCLQLPKGGTLTFNWWGNLVWQETLDGIGTTLLEAPATGFGPTTWRT